MDRIDNQPTNRSTNRPTQHPDGLLVVAGDATKRRGMHAPVPAVKLWRQEIIGAPPTAATTRALRGWCRGAARAGGAVDVCLCVIETHQIDVRMRRASCVVRRASCGVRHCASLCLIVPHCALRVRQCVSADGVRSSNRGNRATRHNATTSLLHRIRPTHRRTFDRS